MFNATIVGREEVTPDLIILKIQPHGGVPDFKPGQYVAIGLPGSAPRPPHSPPDKEPVDQEKIIKRAYSIGSSPTEKGFLELYIAIVPDGALTPRLVLPKVGESIFVAPKITGTFTLEGVPADHNLVLVSTGTGVAPYLSMIRTESTWTPQRQITVVHGVRHAADLGYRAELEMLARERGSMKYHPIVSRADDGWSGHRGRVQRLFDEQVISLDPERDHVFLCGNPQMIEEMEGFLGSLGYSVHSKKNPVGKLHVEKYW